MDLENSKVGDNLTKTLEHPDVVIQQLEEFEGTEDELKDYLFHEYAKQALIEDFALGLEGYFDKEDVNIFIETLMQRSEEHILSVLSLPNELREQWFTVLEQAVRGGESMQGASEKMIERFANRGFSIGYHTSPVDIKPDSETGRWSIHGTEADHRDGDRLMAYYSSQYRHLYKKKNAKYIYIVRTNPDDKTDGNWSRSGTLSVVMRLPLQPTLDFVEKTVRGRKTPDAQSVASGV